MGVPLTGAPQYGSGACAGRSALKPMAPVYGLCWSGWRHHASSSPQGDGRPCWCGCTLQTTDDWPHRCRKSKVPRHPATGHGSCGSPWASRKTPWPWSSRTTGRGCVLRCCITLFPPMAVL